MNEIGATAYEEAKRQAWVLPLLALSAYPVACAMFLSLPSEARSLDDQAAGMLMAAAGALIVGGPLASAGMWLVAFTPRVLKARAARLGREPGAEPDPARHLAKAYINCVTIMVALTDTPVLGGMLLALVPGADMRLAAYVAIAISLAFKAAMVGGILWRSKALLLEAGR